LDHGSNDHTSVDGAKGLSSNLVLTGISGSGKSTIGSQLAKLLGLGFIDLDRLVEKSFGKSITDVFEQDGEVIFREREQHLLRSLGSIRCHVVAVGGGALQSTEAITIAREIGHLIWIQSSPMEIARRLFKRPIEIESRPLFKDLLAEENHEARKQLIQLRVQKYLEERSQWFSEADTTLDASYVTPEMAAQHLKDMLFLEGMIHGDRRTFAIKQ
jgi:shikimate kinase